MKSKRAVFLITGFVPLFLIAATIATRAQERVESLYVKEVVIPSYSALARKAAIQGDVVTVLEINSGGEISSIVSIQGPSLLIDTVRSAIKQWKFVNLLGKSVEASVTFRFKLAGNATDENIETKVRASLPELVEITANPPTPIGPDVEYRNPKRKQM